MGEGRMTKDEEDRGRKSLPRLVFEQQQKTKNKKRKKLVGWTRRLGGKEQELDGAMKNKGLGSSRKEQK